MALAFALGFLAFALWRLPDFGPTWDCVSAEYPQGEQYLGYLLSGDARYLDFASHDVRPEFREPHLAYPDELYAWYGAHPFGAILSALSCKLFWQRLGWMSALSAHHLVIPASVALLLFVLVRWASLRWGRLAGAATALALLLSPRFLADAFNNLKDAPEASLYTFAVLAFAAALTRPRPLRFVLAGMLTGLALAQKPNAGFIPLQMLITWALMNLARRRGGRPMLAFPWSGALLAAAVGVASWVAVSPMLWHDTWARMNVELEFLSRRGTQDIGGRLDGLQHVLWTTPPVLLLLAAFGAGSRRLSSDDRCLLAVGVLLPIGRTLTSGANFDGVRHFLEFQPFLALLAGVGVLRVVDRMRAPSRAGVPAALVVAALFATPAWAVASTWPNGTTYYNAVIGGLSGARSRGVNTATDYWGNSYWQGLAWLSEHATPGASVIVPVSGQIAACGAPLRLRPDLRLLASQPDVPPDVLYVMFIVYPGFYDSLALDLDSRPAADFTIAVQGAPILKIVRLADRVSIETALSQWKARDDDTVAARRLRAWMASQPGDLIGALEAIADQRRELGDEECLRRVRALLPPELHESATVLLSPSR